MKNPKASHTAGRPAGDTVSIDSDFGEIDEVISARSVLIKQPTAMHLEIEV